ncbi:MAG TPA: sigma factor-like helix-turn-helix DNA-binding protein [Candidatus Saccharimonadales bacterium]|nr:sigma factor-like helix-turn-helix DNA-binding protein [Candidatus Saccharimonadales bacterium]
MVKKANEFNVKKITTDILATIEREREREIISRRFGLFDRKETLEQIGELLVITRERVRQLEKAVLQKLKLSAKEGKLPHINDVQSILKETIHESGDIIRIADLSNYLTENNTKFDRAQVSFLAELCPNLVVINENDDFYHAVTIKSIHDQKQVEALINEIIAVIGKMGAPAPIEKIAKSLDKDLGTQHVKALATVSKHLASLNGQWGLNKWPTVNPKNIRDKIYVILKEQGRHMHFNEISDAIKKSDFKRKNVTTQAIHNELIKDKRFVLIGRGIYALKEWGYEKGTVADIITEVLKNAQKPLHRDEIIKQVLKSRFVKETTILLNLQGKPQFKRVAKATYALVD